MVTKNIALKAVTIGLATCLGAMSSPAFAAGFALWEYNGEDIGNSGAGAAAIAEDASTGFVNPAGLVRVPNPQITLSADPIDAHADFHGQACGGLAGPNTVTSPLPGVISNGCNLRNVHNDGGTFAVVPAMAASAPITDRWFAGFDINAPFGLKTDYGRRTPVQFSATHSEIFTINLNPNLAFKYNEHWSFGAGVDALYLNAILNQTISLFPEGAGFATNLGFGPITLPIAPTQTSQVENHADDWGYGWNVGALFQLDESTRIGLSYRSHIVVKPTGTSKIYGAGTPALRTTDASTKLNLPPTTILSIYHLFNPQWAVMASTFYTQWSNIQNIVLKHTAVPNSTAPFTVVGGPPSSFTIATQLNPTFGVVSLPEKFRNTFRTSAGVDYMPTSNWRLRAGIEFDETPIKNKYRTVRLPDGNRWVGSVGAGYKMSDNFRFDAGYAHLFIADGPIHQANPVAQTSGVSDNSADVIGLQATITLT